MNLITFFVNAHSNSDSYLEWAGDLFLSSSRFVFGGKKFVLLEQDGRKFRYESPEDKYPKWVRNALLLPSLVGCILLPVGVLLKSASLLHGTRNAFSDWTTPLECSRNGEELINLLEKCKQYDVMKALYFEILSHPERYLEELHKPFESIYAFRPLKLYECSCSETQAFNRFKSPRRVYLEDRIVEDICNHHLDKEKPIRLLSMGAGGCLQEWIVVGRLLKAGYQNIHLAIVDPQYRGNEDPSIRLQEFFNEAKAGIVRITPFSNIEDLNELNFDAVLAIDFENILEKYEFDTAKEKYTAHNFGWEDIISAQKKLHQEGRLYLGYGQEDMIISNNGKIKPIGKPFSFSAISNDVNSKKEKVSIAASLFSGTIQMLLPVLTKLVELGIKEIDLNFVGTNNSEEIYNIKTLKKILLGYIPENISLRIEHSSHPLEPKQKHFDFVVTGEDEEIASNEVSCSELLNKDGVAYQVSCEGDIHKITRTSTRTLLSRSLF